MSVSQFYLNSKIKVNKEDNAHIPMYYISMHEIINSHKKRLKEAIYLVTNLILLQTNKNYINTFEANKPYLIILLICVEDRRENIF